METANSKTKIVVIGGTGLIGSKVVAGLNAQSKGQRLGIYTKSEAELDEKNTKKTKEAPAGETLTVDFTGSAPQARGAINLPLSMTKATVFGTIKSIVGMDVLTNVGFVRPITVVAPEGTIVNPRFPAAVGGRAPLFFRVFDVLFRALAKALPDRVPIPGEGGDVLHFTGQKADGTNFAVMDIYFGGWGGRPPGFRFRCRACS